MKIFTKLNFLLPLVVSLSVGLTSFPGDTRSLIFHGLFLVFFIVVPAVIYGNSLELKLTDRYRDNLYAFVLGLAFAMGVLLTISFIIARFKLPGVVIWLVPFCPLAVFSTWNPSTLRQIFVYTASSEGKAKNYESFLFIICGVFYLLCHNYTYTKSLQSNPLNGLTFIYNDILWTLGNTFAIIRSGLPLIDARFSGFDIVYHFGESLFEAASTWAMGTDPISVHLWIDPIFQLGFLLVVVWFGLRNVIGLSVFGTIFGFCGIFLMAFGNPRSFRLQRDLLFNPISFTFSVSIFISFLFGLFTMLRSRRLRPLYLWICFFGLTLLKAPLLVQVCAAILFGCCLLLILNSVQKDAGKKPPQSSKTIIFIATFTIILMLVGKIVLYNDADGASDSLMQLVSNSGSTRSDIIRFIKERLSTDWLPIIISPYFCLGLPLSGYAIYKKGGRTDIVSFATITAGIGLSAAALHILFDLRGGAGYPGFYITISLVILLAMTLDQLIHSKYRLLASFITIAVSLFTFQKYTFTPRLSDGFFTAHMNPKPWAPSAAISSGELEAMKWIRTNTAKDAIILCDRRGFKHPVYPKEDQIFFYYSALSGRQMYNEGDVFIQASYRNEANERWRKVKNFLAATTAEEQKSLYPLKNGQDSYFIVSKRFNNPQIRLQDGIAKVFSNNDADIYHVNFK